VVIVVMEKKRRVCVCVCWVGGGGGDKHSMATYFRLLFSPVPNKSSLLPLN
jgi:hypothetical protein